MRKITFVIGLVALLSAGCGHNADQKRYEVTTCPFTVNGTTYVSLRELDTFTGDVWLYVDMHKDQDSNWTYSGNPTKLHLKRPE